MARKAANESKAERSITVRLDPKIRFGLELLARRQRRTISSVVEWALQRAIRSPDSGLVEQDISGKPANILDWLWDVEEADRLYGMANVKPDLLTFEEECLVKVIRESDYYLYLTDKFHEYLENDLIKFHENVRAELRQHYNTYKKVAAGELTKDALPKPPRGWSKPKPQKKPDNSGSAAV